MRSSQSERGSIIGSLFTLLTRDKESNFEGLEPVEFFDPHIPRKQLVANDKQQASEHDIRHHCLQGFFHWRDPREQDAKTKGHQR